MLPCPGRAHPHLQESQTGLYGDPTVATAETGRVVMDAAVAEGAGFLREYWARQASSAGGASSLGAASSALGADPARLL